MEKKVKDDILAFLDSKFANLDSKRESKKKKKKTKKHQNDPEPIIKQPEKTPIVDAIANSSNVPLTSETVYAALATDAELNQKIGQTKPVDNLGVKAMKEFHLKEPACYDKDLKDKIFFIAQNALGGNDKLVKDQSI